MVTFFRLLYCSFELSAFRTALTRKIFCGHSEVFRGVKTVIVKAFSLVLLRNFTLGGCTAKLS